MPPKKAATNGDAGEAGGPFKWEGPNDTKLLLLTQGRYVKPDEYPQLSSAFPGTSIGSIRNRISALRVKQRDLYLELSWDLPEGGAGHSAKKTATTPRKTPGGKKRGVDAVEGDGLDEDEVATPSKKPRAKKAKTQAKKKEEEESVEDAVEEEDVSSVGDGKSVGVKEEVLDEELDEMV
ncbi:hypothetical protein J4E90_003046 [Alternaria incomplexa]|uniref:uncharacterized protein n=1 Tax=Alternaria incomplexa TaxID=1187928 RepID=UPI00221F8F2D|nr:uncharacterized protein J4E90_003046 [Alternaria incomplexa]KAI4918659.1 hypothetical protein J4E90_003046 [Alternaria incomplexa]